MRDWDNIVHRTVRATEKVFGRNVTFASGDLEPVTIRAVFDAAHKMVSVGEVGVAYSTTAPICDVRASDLPWTPQAGDTVMVGDSNYTVIDVQPDGAGTWRLILREGILTRY